MSETPKTPKATESRRKFIKTAAAAGATVAAAQSASAGVYKSILPSTILGANEKIRTGHIGVGGMGSADLVFVMKRNDMEPIALCDLYQKNLDKAHTLAKRKPGLDPTKHHDFREIIENKDVDAVVIATPDHWHCLCTLHAADAGKAIYCEKPAATTIEEGAAMVKAVRSNNVVFQAGNMQRSGQHFQEAVQMIRSGYIGKVHRVETWIHDNEPIAGIGMGENDQAKYEERGLDWDFHQGWTKHVPFNTNRWIYNFRWFLDYSGGKITDWGAHLLDIALWAMEDEDVKPNLQPKSVVANGGKWVLEDNRTTPDTMDVLFEFDDFTMSFENRVWNGHVPADADSHGIMFHGTLGSLQVSRGGYQVWATDNNADKGKKTLEEKKVAPYGPLNEPHWENFANCVRSGENPISTVEVIHNTTRLCHLGTCSYVAGGAKLGWDADKQKFTGADRKAVKKANKHAYRKYNNGWSLKAPYYRG